MVSFYKYLLGIVIALIVIQSVKDKNHHGITFFLSGDVMTGRGIDQILPNPNRPELYESYVKDAREYVRLAEEANGPIRQPVSFEYIWGMALEEFDKRKPDLKLINLETSVTKEGDFWKDKGIHYRMHPLNMEVLKVAGINCVSLANNHTLDWGYDGLEETFRSLEKAKIPFTGAGRSDSEASGPAIFKIENTRVLVFGLGMPDCGIPPAWRATPDRPGLFLLPDYSAKSLQRLKKTIELHVSPGDLVIVSVHWGGNWGYEIGLQQKEFARLLIDQCGVDLVHGHSSHHVKGLEVYKGKLILYGAGDLITDYEGISGHESYRADLGLLYFASLSKEGDLKALEMVPTQMKRFRLSRPGRSAVKWIHKLLNRECAGAGLSFRRTTENTLVLD